MNLKGVDRYKELYASLLTSGYVFEEVWIDKDDNGNIATASEWGNTFFTEKMAVAMFSEHFDLTYVAKRTNQHNQDVYVIRKL